MRGDAASMTVLRPRSAAEAQKLYLENPKALPLAGGTDVMVGWNLGLMNGRALLDLSGVREWTQVKATAGKITLGSLVTHFQAQMSPAVRRSLPLLVEACSTVGAIAIQTRGTLGGNLANASPAGDTFPPLAVYEAAVKTTGRSIPLSNFFAGVKKSTLAPGELITSIEVPVPAKPTRQLFRKVGTRRAQAISKTVAAGLLWLERGAVRELRFALGSVAPTVKRLSTVESLVRGQKLTPALVEEACRALERDISPIDDIRSTREYRLTVSKNILRSFLTP